MRAAHLTGERKIVTILFADVVGSTALVERMDAEDWTAIINGAFERFASAIQHRGGTVARLMGDGLLAFFGAPVTHEDDPARAVQAGLDLLAETAEYAAAPDLGTVGARLELRIGVATGPVVLGDVGSEAMYEYTAMGDAVNLAARLQAAADPMGLLICEHTHRRVAALFDCVERGPVRIKGKSESVRVYEVRGRASGSAVASPAPLSARGIAHRIVSPLVGRADELAIFQKHFAALDNGRGGLIALTGDAGVGKSRLVAEARRLGDARQDRWLLAESLSFGRSITYWPFHTLIRDALQLGEDWADPNAWATLETQLSGLFGSDVSDLLPYLGVLVGLDPRGAGRPGDRMKYLDGEAMRRQVFRAARLFFERLTLERPLVLVLEDMHWLDEASTELVEHLLSLIRSRPLLVCGVSRREPGKPLERLIRRARSDYHDQFSEIALNPLTIAHTTQLLEHLLDSDDLSTALRQRIAETVEGNPFFAEEVVRSLTDQHLLVWHAATNRWRAVRPPSTIALPDTVQGVIASRLDELEHGAREVLKIAAVIGRTFHDQVLRTVAGDDGGVDRHLAELQRLDMVQQQQRTPELVYSFKHGLIQEAVYQSTVVRQRRELHRRTAEAIERVFADRLEEVYCLLAYHWAQVDDWQRARQYLLRAGDLSGRVAADSEALWHYRRAIAAADNAGTDDWQPGERAILERKIGEALFHRGEHDQARAHLERSLSGLGAPALPESRWKVRSLTAAEFLRQVWHTFAHDVRRSASSQPVDSLVGERLRAYRLLAWINLWTDRERFALQTLMALRTCERAGDRGGEAESLAGIGMMCDLLGAFGLAERLHRRAVRAATLADHPSALASAYGGLGHHYDLTGELTAAADYYDRSARAASVIGDTRQWGSVVWGRCYVLCQAGHIDEAAALAQQVVQVGEETGDAQVRGWGLQCLGEARTYQDELGEAEEFLQTARDLLTAVPDHLALAYTFGCLAQCWLRGGDEVRALAVLEQGLAHIKEREVRGNNVNGIRTGLAEVRLRLAERSNERSRADALARARSACATALAHARVFRLAQPAAYRLQGTLEMLGGDVRSARHWWDRSLRAARARRQPMELQRVMEEVQRWLPDSCAVEGAAT